MMSLKLKSEIIPEDLKVKEVLKGCFCKSGSHNLMNVLREKIFQLNSYFINMILNKKDLSLLKILSILINISTVQPIVKTYSVFSL